MTKHQLRRLLKLLGLSQGKLAKESGVTRTAIGNYYNGRRPVNPLLSWGLGLKENIVEKDKRIAYLEKKVAKLSQKARN